MNKKSSVNERNDDRKKSYQNGQTSPETSSNTEETKTKVKLSDKIKHLALEWILTSTSHGLPNIFRTEQIYLKVIWLFLFLASTAACAYIVVNYIINFLTYSVTVSTTIINEAPADFPAVTICNLNPWMRQRAYTYISQVLAKNNMSSYLSTLSSLGGNDNAMTLNNKISIKIKATMASDPSLNGTTRKQYGFYLDDMLLSCSYYGSTCSSSDFSYFVSYDYGNCYTFNGETTSNGSSATIKTISSAGPYNGLELELFSGDPNDELFVYKRGFYVVIHNQTATPIMDNEGVHVATGVQTNIGVDRQFYFKLSEPYSDCVVDTTSVTSYDSDLYRAIFDELNQESYRQKYCYKLCYQVMVIEQCSCFDSEYPNPFPSYAQETINACQNSSQFTCISTAKTTFETEGISDTCDENCPQECSSLTYSTTISTAQYPTDWYVNWLMVQSNFTTKFSNQTSISTQIKSTVAKINVFYNDISYTALVESASMTWDTLLGNIGGQLGLFVGISFLSIAEVLEVTLEVIRTIWVYRRETKKIQQGFIK